MGHSPYQPSPIAADLLARLDSEGALEPTEDEDLCPVFLDLSGLTQHYGQKTWIGEGAVKQVFQCHDYRTKREIAYATPKPSIKREYYDDFIYEARLTARLSHPNIIKIYDLSVDLEQRPYFTMTLKSQGMTLERYVHKADSSECLEAFMRVCDAVSYAHSHDTLHLDLKPENIQCDDHGEVLVCDWGLGKFTDVEADVNQIADQGLLKGSTLHGRIKGSLGFMAPEQARGDQAKDERTDLYALGCILYYLFLKEPPYTGSPEDILLATAQGQFNKLSETRRIPRSLKPVIEKCLAIDPADRYQSVDEFKRELTLYRSGHSPIAERPSLLRRVHLLTQRHMLSTRIIALALIGLGLISIFYTFRVQRIDNERQQAKGHAEKLSSEMNELHADYQKLGTIRTRTNQAMYNRFLALGRKNMRDEFWKNPLQALQETRAFMSIAERLVPHSGDVARLTCELDCISLNFKAASNAVVPEGYDTILSFQKFAQQFPAWEYDFENRPSYDTLCELLETASERPRCPQRLLLTIIHYDWHTREDKTEYIPVLGALLEYANPRANIEFTRVQDSITLKSRVPIDLVKDYKAQEARLLSYLSCDTLKLNLVQEVDIADLNGATIRVLDLTQVNNLTCKAPLQIHNLEKVFISKQLTEKDVSNIQIYSDAELILK